tara:strand:- start:64 stop:372 length:309 start_codon:yes stop_codon:yes gene_type:complete
MIYILSLMSEEQLKAFLEKVKADTSLQEKLKAAGDANAVAAIAKEAGFIISADDLTKSQSELSDEELEGVAGGNLLNSWLVCEVRCRSVDGVGTNKWVQTNQ